MNPFGLPRPEAFTTSAPTKGGTTIAYLKGASARRCRRISTGDDLLHRHVEDPLDPLPRKNMPSIFSPPGSPPIPKCPGNGSALT